ncbi:hypothetical protein [Catenulispora subtropica]|uniref:Hydrogenase maturation protease n=1 Tax=Catenulispora subtropica TaxID=450798 RepID=A0ABP5EP63_9ACTN
MTAAGPPVVIGVGEEFRHDDAVGPAVVAELRRSAVAGTLPPGTRLEVCFGEPTELIELWRGAGLAIVVDAAAADPRAGLAAGDAVRWEVCGRGREHREHREPNRDRSGKPAARRDASAGAGRLAAGRGSGPGSGSQPGSGSESGSESGSGSEPGSEPGSESGSGSEPGSVAVCPGPAATHGLGPGAAIALAEILDRLPGRLVLFAVAGADFAPGPGLSPEVAEAVRRVAGDIAAELRGEGLSARSDGDLLSWSEAGARPRLVP